MRSQGSLYLAFAVVNETAPWEGTSQQSLSAGRTSVLGLSLEYLLQYPRDAVLCPKQTQPLAFSEPGRKESPGVGNGNRIALRPGPVAFHLPRLLLCGVLRTLICMLFEVNRAFLNEAGDEGGGWDQNP